MSDDFRYNEHAESLEDNLEDVLESHKAEKEAKEKLEQLSTEPPALERIVKGHTASDEVRRIVSETKAKEASVSDLIIEHRLARRMQKLAGRRRSVVNEFLALVKG